jgi:hypothetical protein
MIIESAGNTHQQRKAEINTVDSGHTVGGISRVRGITIRDLS